MPYSPRNNTIQERIVDILNKYMLSDVWYPHSAITQWLSEFKEGTVSSVLSKCKSVGAIEYNISTGDRRRISNIDYIKVIEYVKRNQVRSNDLGITKVVCNRVKSLSTCDFTEEEVSNILGIKLNLIQDIVKCEYNIHMFNQNWREEQVKSLDRKNNEELFTTRKDLHELEEAVKEALNNLVCAVYTLADRDKADKF